MMCYYLKVHFHGQGFKGEITKIALRGGLLEMRKASLKDQYDLEPKRGRFSAIFCEEMSLSFFFFHSQEIISKILKAIQLKVTVHVSHL